MSEWKTMIVFRRGNKTITLFLKEGESTDLENIVDVDVFLEKEK